MYLPSQNMAPSTSSALATDITDYTRLQQESTRVHHSFKPDYAFIFAKNNSFME